MLYMTRLRTIKRIGQYIFSGLLIGILFLLFLLIPENPYLSNYLKRLILPELQSATGYAATADRIYLHIFPLYAGIKDLRFIDKDGEVVARIRSIKVYPEVFSLFFKKPVIRRISIKAPSLKMDMKRIDQIKQSLEDYLSERPKGPPLIINRIEISEGDFSFYRFGEDLDITLKGISFSYRMMQEMEFNTSIEDIRFSSLGAPISLTASLSVKPDALQKDFLPEKILLKELNIIGPSRHKETSIKLSGRINTKAPSELKALFRISMKDMVTLFSLKSVTEDRGRVSAKGTIKIPEIHTTTDLKKFFEEVEFNLKGDGEFYIENLMELLRVSERLSGRLKAEFLLKGLLKKPFISGTGHLFNGDLFGVEVDDLFTKVQYRDHRLIFTNAVARIYNGRAEAEAEIPLPVHTFRLYVKAQDIDLRPVLRLLHLDLLVPEGKIEGELSHSGKVFSPSGWFVYEASGEERGLEKENVKLNPLKTLKEVRGDYMFNGEDNVIVFHNLVAQSDLISIVAKGSYSLSDKYIDGRYLLHLRFDGVSNSSGGASNSSSVFPYLKFEKGDLRGNIKGILSDALITGDLDIKDFSLNGYTFNSVKGKVSYSPSLLHIEFINGISQDNSEEFRISGDIRFQNARGLFDLSSPVFNLKTVFKNLRPVKFFSVDSLSPAQELTLDGEILFTGDNHAQKFILRAGRESTKIEGLLNLTEWKNYSYSIYSLFSLQEILKDWRPDNSLGFIDTLKGPFLLKAQGTGQGEKLSGFAELSTEMLNINGRPVGSVKIRSVIEQGSFKEGLEIATAGSLFDGLIILKGRLHSYLRKEINEPHYSFEVLFKEGDYRKLLHALLKESPEDLELDLMGNLIIKGQGTVISGEAFFDKFVLTGYGHQLKNNGPVQIDIAGNVFTVKNFNMINEAGSITCSGKVLIGQWYDLVLKGRSYLWPFKRFFRSIKTIKGKVDFELAINGRWDSPGVSGFLVLKEGTIGIEDLPYHVTEVESMIRFKENRIDLESLTGKVAGGNVMAKGVAYLRGYRLGRFNIKVNMDNINATLSEDFNATLNADLYLKGDRYINLITGEAKLKRAFYRKFIEWRSWMLRFKKEPPQPELSIPSYLNARLNIRITGPLGEPPSLILIDNNIANAELKVDLLLKGTLQKPIIIGRVETIKGVVYFRNNELKLIKASADFTDPERIDPYLRIRAETLSRGYRINLFIEGTLRRFNLSLTSEPPLDEVDIISLLAIGETGTALKGYGGGIGAAEAASFITGELQETLEQRARYYTGIDRVQISPYVSKTGEVGPRVTVGKKLGERVSILYSSAVGSKESDVIRIEYELSRSVFLVGEKDERGSLGGDIRFRFQFR